MASSKRAAQRPSWKGGARTLVAHWLVKGALLGRDQTWGGGGAGASIPRFCPLSTAAYNQRSAALLHFGSSQQMIYVLMRIIFASRKDDSSHVLYQPDVFNCSPPPSIRNLAKPVLQWGPHLSPPPAFILRPKGVSRGREPRGADSSARCSSKHHFVRANWRTGSLSNPFHKPFTDPVV